MWAVKRLDGSARVSMDSKTTTTTAVAVASDWEQVLSRSTIFFFNFLRDKEFIIFIFIVNQHFISSMTTN